MSMEKYAAFAGAVGGLIGALTGGISLLLQRKQSNVSLEVIPYISREFEKDNYHSYKGSDVKKYLMKEEFSFASPYMALRLINSSPFSISIVDAGFAREKSNVGTRLAMFHVRAILGPQHIYDDQHEISFPIRLESRESVLIVWDWPTPAIAQQNAYKYAYASTSCGESSFAEADTILDYCLSWRSEYNKRTPKEPQKNKTRCLPHSLVNVRATCVSMPFTPISPTTAAPFRR